MRRSDRQMFDQEAYRLLEQSKQGVLCVVAADDLPYGVPLNYCYVREDNAVFFHCANEGFKLDAIRNRPNVCLTVVGDTEIDAERLTTRYESVIATGRASIVTEENDKLKRLDQLCAHLTGSTAWRKDTGCARLGAVTVVRVDIESVTGKRNR